MFNEKADKNIVILWTVTETWMQSCLATQSNVIKGAIGMAMDCIGSKQH